MTRRIFVKLAFFLLPFALILIVAVGLAVYSGEVMPLFRVIDWQSHVPSVRYDPLFAENHFAYKLLTAARRQPEVIAIGSSRVYEFRAELLNKNPAAFYN